MKGASKVMLLWVGSDFSHGVAVRWMWYEREAGGDGALQGKR
jgi:hypothetical protein